MAVVGKTCLAMLTSMMFLSGKPMAVVGKTVLLLVLLLPLSACAATETQFFSQLDRLEAQIDQERWELAGEEVRQIKDMYDKAEWKLQLLGDEREYETIEEKLAELEKAIEEKDRTQAKMILAVIRNYLETIFRL